MDFTDKNVSFFFAESVFWPVKSVKSDVHVTHTILKLKLCHFQKSTVTFFYYKYFGRYQHLNDEQLQNAFPLLNEFSEMALYIQAD